MDRKQQDRLRRLFTRMAIILEDTHMVAIKGQAAHINARRYARLARRVARAGVSLTEAAEAALKLCPESIKRRHEG